MSLSCLEMMATTGQSLLSLSDILLYIDWLHFPQSELNNPILYTYVFGLYKWSRITYIYMLLELRMSKFRIFIWFWPFRTQIFYTLLFRAFWILDWKISELPWKNVHADVSLNPRSIFVVVLGRQILTDTTVCQSRRV